tara:strand:+ start:357 stop:1028 length:672 start_codon:yes stop_codon:yes gene_type:complete
MQILVLNGGKGTRVKSVSRSKPKCMILFKKKPFIFHQIKLLQKKGFSNITFCLGYRSKKIINYLKSLKFKKLKLDYVVEKKKLGTAGAVINAKKKINNIFFLTYGDSYLDINYKKALSKFKKNKKRCLMTVVKKKYVKNHKCNVQLNGENLMHYGYSSDCNYIDFGALIFSKKVFDRKKTSYLDLRLIINDLVNKHQIKTLKINKKFLHIGSIQGIKEFTKTI